MKISQHFQLNRTQFELDFVDIDPDGDLPLFVDPYFLGTRQDRFSIDANATVESFFQHFIDLMVAGEHGRARELFDYLHEPNETCLGLSKGVPRGNGVGNTNANAMFASIRQSRALQTGLLEHLEDFRLFIPDIDKDKVSDMTTNIIRRHLLDYTKDQCRLWNIPMQAGVATGPYWNRRDQRWEADYDEMLVVDGRKLLLVPKAVVSYAKQYTQQQFHQHFVLSFLQHDHLRRHTALVQRRRNKRGDVREFVTKKSVREHEAPLDKDFLARFTTQHKDVFRVFRQSKRARTISLSNHQLDPATQADAIIDHLIARLQGIQPGGDEATAYHRTIAAILELVFYPTLICPKLEREINEGRKRIDLTFDNAAEGGFFDALSRHHNITCMYIFVECKNYGRELGNPEVDQLLARFHPNKGRFGLLTCRTIEDMPTLLARCRDAHNAQQGLVIPLTDADLLAMLEEVRAGRPAPGERRLADRLREIALR